MSKQLYEEALADVKQIKEVAFGEAQRAVLDAVTPRIRELIETELLQEGGDGDHDADDEMTFLDGRVGQVAARAPGIVGGLVADPVNPIDDVGAVATAITPPDAEGKVTLDIDALCADEAGVAVEPPVMGVPVATDEYEISLESVAALAPVIKATRGEISAQIRKMGDTVARFVGAGRLVKESSGFHAKIAQLISRVEDMYDHVQESVTDSAKKGSYETKLETFFKELNRLQEQTMSKRTKKMMNEEDVTLKLTGLPDDIDLDSVGVDLITGEEGDDALGAGDAGEGEEGGEDMDLGDLDLGGSESGDEGEEDMGESRRLSDDTIVEIDESMLRREIARMRKLREETAPSADGHGVGAKEFDDFGGGHDDGEALDADIVDLSPAPAARPLGEADDEDLDEQDQMDESDDDQMDESDDQMDEMDDLDQLGVKRKEEDYGSAVADGHETPHSQMPTESIKRRLGFEKRLQERAKARAAALKKEAGRARAKKDLKKESLLKKEYSQVAKRFNESLERTKNLSRRLAESAKPQRGSRPNGGPARSAESQTVNTLRTKLAETNLINAKLIFTNKLLQNESLTARQKAQVIEQLDSAKTVREAKLVYESLAKTLAGTSKSVNESVDRKVLGSASRTTRPASTQTLNEGYESERWAKLAGIVK